MRPFWRASIAAVVMSSLGVVGRVYRQARRTREKRKGNRVAAAHFHHRLRSSSVRGIVAEPPKSRPCYPRFRPQVNVDVFLLDWGKPRTIIDEYAKKREGPLSCWRQLFVANEWNELQTERITNIEATYLFAVLFLEARICPGTSSDVPPK